jgi:hypothetical protein
LIEALLVGLGGDLEGQVPDGELGLTEQGSGPGLLESTDHFEELPFDELREFVDELLGGDILISAERLLHDGLTDKEGGFLGETPGSSFVYKDSTNFRDAYTEKPMSRFLR